MAHDEFVHDTHAAMHLHGLLPDQPARLSDIGFGCRYGALPLRRVLRIRVTAAMIAIERACSAAISMSAMRCFSA